MANYAKRVALVALLSLAAVAGGLVTHFGLGPAEVSQSREPPERSILWVEVESRIVQDQLVFRGVTAPEVAVPYQARTRSVVTSEPRNSIEYGGVLVELSGRPVFMLRGELPAYRSLGLGATGPDVTQLNAALAELGFDTHGREFTSVTAAAVSSLFRDAGYELAPGDLGDLAGSVVLRAEEVMFVTGSALRITSEAERGQWVEPGDVVTTVGSGGIAAVFDLSPAQFAVIDVPALVDVDVSGMTESVTADLSPGAGDSDGGLLVAEISAQHEVGVAVLGTMTFASTYTPVMAVPLSALGRGPAGRTVVLKETPEGTEEVGVEVGLSAGGWVEVHSRDLNLSDRVVVS